VDDVPDEFEEGEDEEEQGEGSEGEEQVGGVGAQDVLVEQEGEAGPKEASHALDEGLAGGWGMERVSVGGAGLPARRGRHPREGRRDPRRLSGAWGWRAGRGCLGCARERCGRAF